MVAEIKKTKSARRVAIPLTIDPEQLPKLEALVQMDGSDRSKVLRKAIDFAFENAAEALKPRVVQ